MAQQREKQLADFTGLISESLRIIEGSGGSSSGADDGNTLSWGALREDPIIQAFYSERLVAVVVAARMNKVVEVLAPPQDVNAAGVAIADEKKVMASKPVVVTAADGSQKTVVRKPVAAKDLRLTTDGSTDAFSIRLLLTTPEAVEEQMKTTAGAKAAANQQKREEDKATRDAERVERHLKRLQSQTSAVLKSASSVGSGGGGEMNEAVVEEVEEVEEFEEEEDEDEIDLEGIGGEDDGDAPPPPPPDDDEEAPPPPPDEDEAPPPPPDDDEEAPPPPPDEDEEAPPPPPDDEEEMPPPPPEE